MRREGEENDTWVLRETASCYTERLLINMSVFTVVWFSSPSFQSLQLGQNLANDPSISK